MELNDLKTYKKLIKVDSKLAAQVETVYNLTKETINSISGCYNNYTMHDLGHCLRVATYMEEIAFGSDDFDVNIERFTPFELALLILSALLHDIGMFIRPEDRESIRNNNIKYTSTLTFDGVLKTVNGDENEAIKEIIRITHAQRIKDFVDYEFDKKTISNILMLDDKYSYTDDVVSICVAHGENYDYLKNLSCSFTKGKYHYNTQYLAAILRIADYLDLDKQRTPVLWYKMMRIDGFSKDEWEKHFIIHNEKKIKKYIDNKMQIFFEGKSYSPQIHRKYLSYVDELKRELENADELLNTKTTQEKYKFNITTKVEDNVTTVGFKYSDLRLNLNYSAITELLMGKNIYGDNKLGLREIIQNSIDACEIMREVSKNGEELIVEPQIFITFSKENKYVKIKDTGIGMTLDVVKKHFLNIGKSYYKSNEYLYKNYKYKPIGQYGIGFLACFLLSDNVIVKTKYYKNNEINQIELEKNSEYVVTNIEETGTFIGTEISLDYDKFFDVFVDKNELISFLEKYFMTSIPIKVKDMDVDSDYTILSNSSKAEIENNIQKDNSKKYDIIDCSEYSNVIQGFLAVCSDKCKKTFKIANMVEEHELFFIFNNEKQKFDIVETTDKVPSGYYLIVPYVDIETGEYEKIKSTRKKNKTKRNEILSIGTKKYLLISNGTQIEYKQMNNDGFHITLNNTFLKDILENSGYVYYEELVDEYEYFDKVFVSNNKLINLQFCAFRTFYFYEYDNDKADFYFYNKGVWIRDFRWMTCMIPEAFNVLGVVNYLGDDIKLDVSRNCIISGKESLSKEFANILLLYLKQKATEYERIEMIDKMIEYNSENSAIADDNIAVG